MSFIDVPLFRFGHFFLHTVDNLVHGIVTEYAVYTTMIEEKYVLVSSQIPQVSAPPVC